MLGGIDPGSFEWEPGSIHFCSISFPKMEFCDGNPLVGGGEGREGQGVVQHSTFGAGVQPLEYLFTCLDAILSTSDASKMLRYGSF